MIDAKELRIGNQIQRRTGQHLIVDINILRSVRRQPVFFMPVLLTEEKLIEFGFEKKEYSVSSDWHIGTNPVTHDWMLTITKLEGIDYFFFQNGGHQIRYVHQLQNLYFLLTGEELIVKQEIEKL